MRKVLSLLLLLGMVTPVFADQASWLDKEAKVLVQVTPGVTPDPQSWFDIEAKVLAQVTPAPHHVHKGVVRSDWQSDAEQVLAQVTPVPYPILVSGPYSGLVAGQTAQSLSFLGAGGIANSGSPTLSAGQFGPLQLDLNGNLKVTGISGTISFPYSTSTNQAPSGGSGSFAGAAALYAASPPTLTSGNINPLLEDVNGNLKVNVVAGGGSLTLPYNATNAQAPASASFLGTAGVYFTSAPTLANGQINPFLMDASGNLKVNVVAGNSSTVFPYNFSLATQTATSNSAVGMMMLDAISPTTQVISARDTQFWTGTTQPGILSTGICGSVLQFGNPINCVSLTSNVNGGVTGLVGGGLYLATPPTLGNASPSPLLMDASGNLNVRINAGGATSPYSMATPGQTGTAASGIGVLGQFNSTPPTLGAGQVAPLQVDVNGNTKVIVENPGVPLAVNPTATATPLLVDGSQNLYTRQTLFGSSSATYSNTIPDTSTWSGNITTATTTTVITGVTGQRPYIWQAGEYPTATNSGATAQWIAGSNSGCSTSQIYLFAPSSISFFVNSSSNTMSDAYGGITTVTTGTGPVFDPAGVAYAQVPQGDYVCVISAGTTISFKTFIMYTMAP